MMHRSMWIWALVGILLAVLLVVLIYKLIKK
jgi:hypothetical protein